MVPEDVVAAFARDGVVCVRSVLGPQEVASAARVRLPDPAQDLVAAVPVGRRQARAPPLAYLTAL